MRDGSTINGTLGHRIAEVCAGGLTMMELAQRSAVSEGTLRRIKRGERVAPETLGRVSAAVAGAALLTQTSVDADLDDRLETVERRLAELDLRAARSAVLFADVLEVILGSGLLGEPA